MRAPWHWREETQETVLAVLLMAFVLYGIPVIVWCFVR